MSDDILIRRPEPTDAVAMHQLVLDSGVLDPNSLYLYLLGCSDFAGTTLVATQGDTLVGFVLGYRPPPRPEAVFVWQIGVSEAARGRGLAQRLLHALVEQPDCEGVRFLEATVTPSNTASRRLFQAFARRKEAPLDITEGYRAEWFGPHGHEREDRFRIGPLR